MRMDWLLIELIVLAILLNIRALFVLLRFRQKNRQLTEDTEALHQNMEEFVSNVEKENEELYQKFAEYIKVKESRLEERIRLLEDQHTTGIQNAPIETKPLQVALLEKVDSEIVQDDNEPENEKVAKLYKQGFSAKQISKVLKVEYGEVELIINMLEKKKSYQK